MARIVTEVVIMWLLGLREVSFGNVKLRVVEICRAVVPGSDRGSVAASLDVVYRLSVQIVNT